MIARRPLPIALTIAGSDSGGGAGLQADLQTFGNFGVHGTTVVTCLTAQNPRGVIGIQSATPAMVLRQLDAVFAELPPDAAKTGMLYSAPIIDAVANYFQQRNRPKSPLIVDPVLIATSGARLLKPSAVRALKTRLLPMATLITPNVDEARALTGLPIIDPEGLRTAARRILADFGCAVLVKGGHLKGIHEAIDIFYDGRTELLLSSPFVRGVATHGTGCTYSAAIAAYCARGFSLPDAVMHAKDFITNAIQSSHRIARHAVLNWHEGKTDDQRKRRKES